MKFFILAVIFLVSITSFSQDKKDWKSKSMSTFLIGAHYAPSFAAGDLAKRYGFLNQVGASVSYKLSSNWVLGLDGSFIFGKGTKMKGLFDHLVDSHGGITNANGDIGVVLANPRGLMFNAHIGKIFPVAKSNPNSGIYVRISGGYMQHKLNVETRDDVIPSLELNYRKGYDRFTSGLASEQLIGYLFMGNNEFVNFYAGAFIQEGFTRNRRNLNYDQPEIPVDKSLRLDLMIGIKVAWMFPAYSTRPKDYYYN